jgi:hypothetical protein
LFFLCAILCTNLQLHVSRTNCVESKSIRHVKLEMLPCNKSNFPTMHDIIYKGCQRSGRDYMAVAFKSSYVIKDWSQFLFGSWRNKPQSGCSHRVARNNLNRVTQECEQPNWGYFGLTEQISSINPYKLIQTFFVMILKNIFIFSK